MSTSEAGPGDREPLLPRSRAEIAQHIPHREPFLFVDEILAFDKDRSVRGALRLTGREAFFAGHFPQQPTFPAVLLLEHMAQTAAFLVARSRVLDRGSDAPGRRPLMLFAGVDRARFLAPVLPGAEIITDVSAIKLYDSMGLLDALSCVEGAPVARARLSFGTRAEQAAAQGAGKREGRR